MMTKSDTRNEQQGDLFKPLLRDIVSPHHAMVKLADAIDWKSFEDGLSASFCADNGRPSCPVRLMVALHYLKYASGMSDEAVLDEWLLPEEFILNMNIRPISRQCRVGAKNLPGAGQKKCSKKV